MILKSPRKQESGGGIPLRPLIKTLWKPISIRLGKSFNEFSKLSFESSEKLIGRSSLKTRRLLERVFGKLLKKSGVIGIDSK